MRKKKLSKILLMAATLLASYGLPAQQASEIINIQEPVDKDIYLAGRSINILSTVTGDAVCH